MAAPLERGLTSSLRSGSIRGIIVDESFIDGFGKELDAKAGRRYYCWALPSARAT